MSLGALSQVGVEELVNKGLFGRGRREMNMRRATEG